MTEKRAQTMNERKKKLAQIKENQAATLQDITIRNTHTDTNSHANSDNCDNTNVKTYRCEIKDYSNGSTLRWSSHKPVANMNCRIYPISSAFDTTISNINFLQTAIIEEVFIEN